MFSLPIGVIVSVRRSFSTPHSQKIALRERVVALRSDGFSYPAIAGQLGISVGTAWNYAGGLNQ